MIPNNPPKKISETLRKAIEVIDRDGWTQGVYHVGGRHCMLGALAIASGQSFYADRTSMLDFEMMWANILGFKDPDEAIAWNDAPHRMIDDVRRRFETTLAWAEAKEREDAPQ